MITRLTKYLVDTLSLHGKPALEWMKKMWMGISINATGTILVTELTII